MKSIFIIFLFFDFCSFIAALLLENHERRREYNHECLSESYLSTLFRLKE